MFSHITVGVSDLDRSGAFYDAILSPLGFVRRIVAVDGGPPALCWHDAQHPLPRFYIYLPFDGQPCSAGNGSMVAFVAPSPAAVECTYGAGIENGGACAGAPGPRDHYGAGYFGAYLRDPDGNKIHIAHRGDLIGQRVIGPT